MAWWLQASHVAGGLRQHQHVWTPRCVFQCPVNGAWLGLLELPGQPLYFLLPSTGGNKVACTIQLWADARPDADGEQRQQWAPSCAGAGGGMPQG